MALGIILTGGTIDKVYNKHNGENDFPSSSHVPEMLKRGRVRGDYALMHLFLKDSLEMDDEDRAMVAEACADMEQDRLVVTHGTDTMVETAKILAVSPKISRKVIVLTGAMTPFSLGEGEDALFNLGAAVAFAQALPSGVYVAMNGQAFDHDNVRKDIASLSFVPIDESGAVH